MSRDEEIVDIDRRLAALYTQAQRYHIDADRSLPTVNREQRRAIERARRRNAATYLAMGVPTSPEGHRP